MDRWNDFAVNGWYENLGDWWWRPILHPWTGKFIDMSFVLTTCKGPIKWLQLPDMANGFNIGSLPMDPVVADDFLCTNGKPIKEVHFWGSYLDNPYEPGEHWQQGNPGPPVNPLPPPPGVEKFKLSFHEDIPAGIDPEMPWSHPGEQLYEAWVDFADVKERYWDSIPHTDLTGETWWEHKFYYIVHLREPFPQEEGKVYWLDIGAAPKDPGTEPAWFWGWETSKDHWNDNAVRGDGVIWEALGRSTTGFEDLTLGTIYIVGQTFTTSGIPITVKQFQRGNGTWTSDGDTTVVNAGLAGGSGNELNVNNVNLDFDIPVPVTGCSLLFGEYGGNCNIKINGDFLNFANLADINGLTIGGVNVSVINGGGNDAGSLTLTGTINSFAIGGQEFFIDDVKFAEVIDMAFLLITDDDTRYCKGDFDRNGNVDGSDLAVFAADFGRTDCYNAGDCEGDCDYNGNVDGSDLAVFAANFGRTDCPCALPVNAH